MQLLWLFAIVGFAELSCQAVQIVWPDLRRPRFLPAIYGGLFVFSAALSVIAGVDILAAVPRQLAPEVRLAFSAIIAGFLTIIAHHLTLKAGEALRRMRQRRRAMPAPTVSNKEPSGPLARLTAEHHHQRRAPHAGTDQIILQLQMSLRARGFLGVDYQRGVFCIETDRAVIAYQKFHGLMEDGLVGPITRDHLKQPRCGRPDVKPSSLEGEAATEPCTWDSRTVTWSVYNAPDRVTLQSCREIAQRAFEAWSAAGVLSFAESGDTNTANIRIGWERERDFPVLGASDTDDAIAYGYAPCGHAMSGCILLDSSRRWSGTKGENEIYKVILHEIGHAIGIIQHSAEADDIMRAQPLFAPGDVTANDESRMRELYP